MTDTIPYKVIRERIKQEAKEIIDQYAQFPKENTYDFWEEYSDKLEALKDNESYDLAHESVEGWDWAIYTYKGFLVYDALNGQEQSDAESLYWDAWSGLENQPTPYELAAGMAFWWLIQELTGEIESQCEEIIEMAQNQMENL